LEGFSGNIISCTFHASATNDVNLRLVNNEGHLTCTTCRKKWLLFYISGFHWSYFPETSFRGLYAHAQQ
jgi:hypothetical protein